MRDPGNHVLGCLASELAMLAASLLPLAAISGDAATLLAAQPAEGNPYR